MERYQAEIADNPKVEWIHVSRDQDDNAATVWAAQTNFPWLTVMPRDVDRSGLLEHRTANSVPHYVMLDGEGNVVANDSAAVFRKIAELGRAAEGE